MERLYVRGSDDRINTDNQLVDLLTVAPNGLLYRDIGSGSSRNRPELERMIEECQSGDIVWIWSLDRLTREGIHATLGYLKRLTGKRARVRSFKESWLDSEHVCYEMMVSCLAFAAKIERDRLIERTSTAIKLSRTQAVAEGKLRKDGTPVQPLVDKKKILEARATGLSFRSIANKLGCSHQYAAKVCWEAGVE